MSTNNPPPIPAVFPVVSTSAQTQALAAAKASGFTQGHAAGYAAGLQLARGEAEVARTRQDADHAAMMAASAARNAAELNALRLAGAALIQRTAPVLADAEAALFSHALELAEALLGHELRDGETSARAALARACGKVGTEVPLSIHMNAADIAALAGTELPDGVVLAEDAAISRGDAVAEYPDGFLDARLASAVRRARDALLGDSLPAAAPNNGMPATEAGQA
ncbi:hypothetical protein AAGW05_04960 [Arthrobacter sp. LAPM80]|uniref:FliH/SctL family protein n=1 Tax=Arthrobacter sp. LAPM80 TaxID=3141788 RepID=UPI00398A642C